MATNLTKISYTATQWTDGYGQPLNANNLNKIEEGLNTSTNTINSIIDNVGGIQGTVSKNSSDIRDLNTTVNTLNSNSSTNSNKITQIETEVNTLKATTVTTDDSEIRLYCGSASELIQN